MLVIYNTGHWWPLFIHVILDSWIYFDAIESLQNCSKARCIETKCVLEHCEWCVTLYGIDVIIV